MNSPKHPNIVVKLTSTDGNAYAILGTVLRALKSAGVSKAECAEFQNEATSSDYDHLLQTVFRWVDVR